jgi:hypothetical protein
MSDDPDANTAIEADQRPLGVIRLGLIATPGVAHDVARDLASKLPEALHGDASSAVAWEVPLVADAFAADARLSGVDMMDRARERMQREGWHLAICLTDLPLRNGRRPVIADASAMHGVALVTSDIWQLADSLGPFRLAGLTLLSVGATVVTLIVAHELWEHGGDGLRREQAVLFNAATTITVVLGVLVLYAALFAVALAGGWLVLADGPLAKTLGHPPNPSDYLRLAWLVSSLSMVGGALGGGLESDETVRQAAYGYRPDPDADQALRYAPADEAG